MRIPAGVVAIVDDFEPILRALQRSLLTLGYRVKAFASAEQYLEEVGADEIACAVIDIQLEGGMSGLELGERIAALHGTPIVFMTGSREPGFHRRAQDIGCVQFLEKPFSVAKLIAAITAVEGRDS